MPLGQGSASPPGWKSMFLALNDSPVWHIIYFFTHNPKFSSESRSESTSGPKLYNIFYIQKRDCKWPIPFRREVPFSHDWCWHTYRFIVYMYTWFIWILFFRFRSFAYLTIRDRMPVILTKVIDLVHRRASAFSDENQQVIFFSGLLW